MYSDSLPVIVKCKECDGSGSTGLICGWRITCRHCNGTGLVLTDYAYRPSARSA